MLTLKRVAGGDEEGIDQAIVAEVSLKLICRTMIGTCGGSTGAIPGLRRAAPDQPSSLPA
jgi:hypothetical protein